MIGVLYSVILSEMNCGFHAHVSSESCKCNNGYIQRCSTHVDSDAPFGPVGSPTHCICIPSRVSAKLHARSENAWHLPRPVSKRVWAPRRKFDPKVAQREGVWRASDGGLNEADRNILGKIFYESDSVFETGVGESTRIAVFTGVPRYTGVDNSIEWLETVSKVSPSHYRFHWADIGTIGSYSKPIDDLSADKWPFSSTAALSAESTGFDFYFVDGRFRVANFAMAFLHARATGRLAHEFKVGIHDMEKRASTHYKACFKIGYPIEGFSVNESSARLTIFRRREEVTDKTIFNIWKQHASDKR